MRKLISLTLAAIVLVILFAACGNGNGADTSVADTPAVVDDAAPADQTDDNGQADAGVNDAEGVKTLRIAHSQDPRGLPPSEMMFTRAYMDRLGFEIDWISIPNEGATERRNLMLASRDLPCVFLGLIGRDEIMRHMDEDMFVPVCDLIDNYMPLLTAVLEQRPHYRRQMTAPDGQIWGFPYIEEMHGLILNQGTWAINQVWMDNVGHTMPTNLDEFVALLRAFRDDDPTGTGVDVIPLTFAGRDGSKGLGRWANGNDFGQFMGLWGQADRGDSLYLDENDQIFFTAADPAFKEMYSFFHGLFAEGLIDPEIFNLGGGELSARLREGVVGVVNNFSLVDRIPDYRLQEFAVMPYLRSELGVMGTRENLSEMHRPTTFVITTACCSPVNAAIFADGFYDPQTSVEANWGPLDYVYTIDERGVMVWCYLKDGLDTFDDMRARHTLGGRQPLAILDHFYDTVVEYPQNAQIILDKMIDMGFFEYHFDSPYIPPLWFTVEEANRIAVLHVQIYENTVDPFRRSWIVDGGVEEQWEEYLAQLEANGLSEFLSIVQTAFDRIR